MQWTELKAALLAAGTCRLSGEPALPYISASSAGPGAGGGGSVFFSTEKGRVRLALDPESSTEIVHHGGGRADLRLQGRQVKGRIEQIGLHCPRQAYITVSSGCICKCRYCEVPGQRPGRKSIDEIVGMVDRVKQRIDAISLTSGILHDVEEEEAYVLEVVEHLTRFGLPIGVSIYPTPGTPERLRHLGVAEVKFNIETATPALFASFCPGLDWGLLWDVLRDSVPLFGRDHVFSNVLVGLGETDGELEECIRMLAGKGIIAVLRPLNPAAELSAFERPSSERLIRLHKVHRGILNEYGLDPASARTMCVACTGCDLVPGRDT